MTARAVGFLTAETPTKILSHSRGPPLLWTTPNECLEVKAIISVGQYDTIFITINTQGIQRTGMRLQVIIQFLQHRDGRIYIIGFHSLAYLYPPRPSALMSIVKDTYQCKILLVWMMAWHLINAKPSPNATV